MRSNQAKNLGRVTFLFLGVSSLIGWNGVLTSLDFYSKQYPNFNVNFIFPIPYTLACCVFGLLIYKISQISTLNQRIIIGSIVLSILLIILPIFTQYNQSDSSFYISLVIVFLIGGVNTIIQSSAQAFASIFTAENYISSFLTGGGLSGVIVCLIKTIFLLTLNKDQQAQDAGFITTLSYHVVSAIILICVIYFYVKFRNTNYCRYYIKVSRQQSILAVNSKYSWIKNIVFENDGKISSKNSNKSSDLSSDLSINQNNNQTPLAINQNSQNSSKKKSDLIFLKQVFRKIWPLPFNVFLIFVITFILFPGISFSIKFNWDLSTEWNITIILFIFNIFDTIGKSQSQFQTGTKRYATITVLIRLAFFASFFLQILPQKNNPIISSDILNLINIALFAFTNGYATSVNMSLAPQICNEEEKETSSFMMSFPLTFGILTGNFLALIFQNIGN